MTSHTSKFQLYTIKCTQKLVFEKDVVELSVSGRPTVWIKCYSIHTFILQLSPTSSLIRLNQDSLNQATSLKEKYKCETLKCHYYLKYQIESAGKVIL